VATVTAERRELVVAGALKTHQMRTYLVAAHKAFALVEWTEQPYDDFSIFGIAATPEQWDAINQWIEKVKG
jgi:hypothetical protein